MDLGNGSAIADRFAAYAGELTKVIGHVDRSRPLRVIAAGYRARSLPDELLQQQNWVSVILFACWRPHSANQTCAARLEHGPIAANGTGRDPGRASCFERCLRELLRSSATSSGTVPETVVSGPWRTASGSAGTEALTIPAGRGHQAPGRR